MPVAGMVVVEQVLLVFVDVFRLSVLIQEIQQLALEPGEAAAVGESLVPVPVVVVAGEAVLVTLAVLVVLEALQTQHLLTAYL